MTERLIEKLDRLANEAGIKDVTPEIRKFALLVRADVVSREWVDLTIEEIAACCMESTTTQLQFARAVLAKSKEKNA